MRDIQLEQDFIKGAIMHKLTYKNPKCILCWDRGSIIEPDPLGGIKELWACPHCNKGLKAELFGCPRMPIKQDGD